MVHRALKILCLGIFVLMLGIPALAQNTKGDRPAPSNRETRFKTPKKSSQKRKPGRRIKERADKPGQRATLPPSKAKGGDRPGRPIRPMFGTSTPSDKQKPWKGDITRRRIRPRSSASRAWNVYPQPAAINYPSRNPGSRPRRNANPNLKRVRRIMEHHERAKARPGRPIRPVYTNTRPGHQERAWRGDITGRRIRSGTSQRPHVSGERNPPRSSGQNRPGIQGPGAAPGRATERARNYYGRSFYVNNQSQRRPRFQTPQNRTALGMLQQTTPGAPPRVKSRKVVPRSASASYLAKRSTNVWARFSRPRRQHERAYTKDLAGKKLRTKNFETRRPQLTNPTLNFQQRAAAGERPYKGPAGGGYITRRPGQKAWRGDIAHWPLRGGKAPGGRANAGQPIPGKAPGIGALGIGKYRGNIKANRRRGFGNQGEEYTGNIRAGRELKGGGSVSGRVWNNKGLPIQGRTPGKGSSGIGYSGNIKAGKRVLNDQGEEYSGNIRQDRKRGFSDQGEAYSGNIKRGKRGFNDQGEEYSGNIKRGKRGFSDQGEEYAGNIKRGKRGFSDQGEEYSGNIKVRRGFNDQGEEYTGNIKARRPEKGGGSVSGKVWNNKNSPIAVRSPRGQTQIARYQGNIKGGKSVLQDQGEEYSGNIKARRPDKGGGSVSGKLWNNKETPIAVRPPKSHDEGNFSGNMKVARNSYRKNPNAAESALRVRKEKNQQGGEFPGNVRLARSSYQKNPKSADSALPVYRERNDQGGDFSGNVKMTRSSYRRNPKSADLALPVLKPTDATAKAGGYSRGTRRDWDYVKNPSTADAALRTREPGRAFARSTNYQGSLKFKKFDLFGKSDLHPDAKFVKLNKNNVAEEKDMLTNLKLWWARLFRKNETQPDHLKEKERKPRYDKGESGMWYE